MGDKDGDGKFGFSERTQVDRGAVGGAPPSGGAQDDAPEKTAALDISGLGFGPAGDDDEDMEKTGAFNIEDLERAGAFDEAPVEKTAALSLDEMRGLPGMGGEEPIEKTAALSLDEMRNVPGMQEERPEKTMALTLDEMRGEAGAADEPAATMMLESPGAAALNARAPALMPPKLEVIGGNDQGTAHTLTAESTLVGRGLDCGIVLNDASVSRKHFRIDRLTGGRLAGGWKLVDLGSGNGTKVNGQRQAEVELQNGMTIDVGTTTLRWADPNVPASRPAARAAAPAPVDQGPPEAERTMAIPSMGAGAPSAGFKDFGGDDDNERTRVGGMAALEVLPEWADRIKAESGSGGGGTAAIGAMRSDEPQRAASSPLKWVGLGLGVILLLGGGFVVADKVAGLGIIFGAPEGGDEAGAEASSEGASAVEAEKVEPPDPRALELLEEGMAAFKEREWYGAREKFKEALKLDDDLEAAGDGLAQVDAEIAAFKAIEDADKALEEKKYSEALSRLRTVGNMSSYYPQARDMQKTARDGMVEEALSKARELSEADDVRGALAAVEVALKAAPEDADALAMKEELTLAAAELGDAAQPATAAADKPSTGGTEKVAAADKPRTTQRPSSGGTRRPATSRPSRRRGVDLSEGLSKYSSKDFSGAISSFEEVALGRGSKADKAKAARLATTVKKFSDAWGSGMSAAKAYKAKSAITDLSRARKLDAGVNGAHQGAIKEELSKQYAYLANMAYQRSDFGAAGSSARKALALNSNQPSAQKIYDEVQAKAQTWLDEAKGLATSNPGKAMQLLSKVLAVFPRGDARYTEAYRLLNELGADSEEE